MAFQRDISLEDAVRNSNAKRFFTWFTSGNILDNNLVKNSYVSRIGVSWSVQKKEFSVTLATHNLEEKLSISELGSFSNLEDLKKHYPQLFDVTGNLDVH